VFTWHISSFSVSPLRLLDAEIVAKLESSTQFVIGTSNSFEVQAEGGEQFELEITSNSNVAMSSSGKRKRRCHSRSRAKQEQEAQQK
jgi:hypothetical protein